MNPLKAHHAFNARRLARCLGGAAGTVAVADLSLGSWRANSVAAQLAAQFGASLPPMPEAYRFFGKQSLAYADVVSGGIDAEAAGNRSIRMALHLVGFVRELAPAEPWTLFVIAPRFGLDWEEEDILFLEFIQRELPLLSIELVACDPEPTLPPNWRVCFSEPPAGAEERAGSPDGGTLALLPQVVTPSIAEQLAPGTCDPGCLVVYSGPWGVVAPEFRKPPAAQSRFLYDRLSAAAAGHDASLCCYAKYYGNNYHAEPKFLCEQAWSSFAAGGLGIAMRLLERAERCATHPLEKAAYVCQKLGMRIARLRFQEVVEQAEVAVPAGTELSSFLAQARGWGLVQLGRAEEARQWLERAQALAAGEASSSREGLYLLNIRALAEFRCGNPAEAMRLEICIEQGLAALAERDWQLEYVNAINQARLYRASRQWPEAAHCYRRAWRTTRGLRTDSDHVYMNLCEALLAEATIGPAAALLDWLRAALYWVSTEWPEALTARILQALLPKLALAEITSRRECEERIETISEALLERLERALGAAGFAPLAQADIRPFHLRGDRGDAVCLAAVGAEGWSVIAAQAPASHPKRRGPQYRRLEHWLCRWIASTCPGAPGDCFLVDDRFGEEMACSLDELRETCLRCGITGLYFGAIHEEAGGDWSEAELIDRLQVRLGSGTAAVGPAEIRFKRYRRPLPLNPAQARLVAEVGAQGCSMGELLRKGHELDLIRSLERERVLEVLTEKSGSSAGADAVHGASHDRVDGTISKAVGVLHA